MNKLGKLLISLILLACGPLRASDQQGYQPLYPNLPPQQVELNMPVEYQPVGETQVLIQERPVQQGCTNRQVAYGVGAAVLGLAVLAGFGGLIYLALEAPDLGFSPCYGLNCPW